MQYVSAGYEDIARSIFTTLLVEFLEKNEIKIALCDANAIRKQINFCDVKNDMAALLDLEIRWMGEDTGKTVIYWVGESIKGALKQFMTKVRRFSPSELKEINKILGRPL